MTGSAAALVSFVESSDLLRELAGVEVSASQVERAAEALGAEIAVDEHHCVEPTGDVAPTMYLGMDGTGVPMRNSEVAGRAGKQPDGSAKTREAKVVTLWTAEARDDQGKPMRDLGSITYSAAIESAAAQDAKPARSDFADRVLREATRRNFTKAPRCAVQGDGSLEHRQGTVSPSHSNSGSVPRQRNPSRHRSGDLWCHQPRGQTMGHGALCGTG
jgi:hypothetical protein